MGRIYAIAAAGGLACAALLLAGGVAEAQRNRVPLNPESITIGRDDGMACVREALDGLARSRNNRRRLVEVECPGVLNAPPISDPYDEEEALVLISLHLIPSEATCLLGILNRDPRTPARVALALCKIPLEHGR